MGIKEQDNQKVDNLRQNNKVGIKRQDNKEVAELTARTCCIKV